MSISRSFQSIIASALTAIVLCCHARAEEQASGADEPKPDKSIYNLFHPTPAGFMRDMDTDRPDATESIHTVDAGHFQIEAGIFAFTLNDHGSTHEKQYDIGNTNYKIGLLNFLDFQAVVDSYVIDKT